MTILETREVGEGRYVTWIRRAGVECLDLNYNGVYAVSAQVGGATVFYGIAPTLEVATAMEDAIMREYPQAASWGSRLIALGQWYHL